MRDRRCAAALTASSVPAKLRGSNVRLPSVVVVANRHRPALVLGALADIDHHVSLTPDYDLPAGFSTGIGLASYNQVGAYRCFRGHQDALALSRGDVVLVLEDDAMPNTPDWWSIVTSLAAWPSDLDIISLHGRGFDPAAFEQRGVFSERTVLVPRFSRGPVRVFGSLAYLIRGAAKQRLMTMRYDGLPVDLLLANRFKFCLLHPSPFAHDRRHASLVG
jgi:hypothetical protein